MSIRKSATFTDSDYADACIVARYQGRNFANYIVHAVMVETRWWIKAAAEARADNRLSIGKGIK